MQTATLKVFVKKRLRPLFVAKIYDDVEKTINEFLEQLDNKESEIIHFRNIGFSKEIFHHYEIVYK